MQNSSYHRVFSFIDSLKGTFDHEAGVSDEAISHAESELGVKFPDDYRAYLQRYGLITGSLGNFCGLSADPRHSYSAINATHLARRASPDIPDHLIPIEYLGQGKVACIACALDSANEEEAPVVVWNIHMPGDRQNLSPIAPSFEWYLYHRFYTHKWYRVGMKRLDYHVKQFAEEHDYDHTGGGKLPRNHVWRPYRYCVQDIVFGVTVVRHVRDENCLEVDVFLTADVPKYEPDAGAEALAVFLLSEAYKCGGTMEIRFTRNVEGGRVPAALRRLAGRHRVELSCVNRGVLLPGEARQLYAALTDFSPEMRAVLDGLQEAGRLSIERACYAIHHGVWSKPEAEAIILSSHYPDSVLGGDTLPEQRHLYLQDLQDACAAILGGALDRRLAMKEYQDASGVTYDLEDDVRDLSITFDPKTYAKTYVCTEDMPIPWLAGKGEGARTMPAHTAMHVLIRARDAAGLKLHMPGDLRLARRVQQEGANREDEALPVFILVPSDFNELGLRGEELINAARAHGIGILVCPESMLTLTEEAARRLASSRVIRDD